MVDRSQNVSLDAWIALGGGTNYGNGKGDFLHVGKSVMADGTTTLLQRSILSFDLTTIFADIVLLTAATLNLKVVSGACDSQGSSPKFFIERFTGTFTENSTST